MSLTANLAAGVISSLIAVLLIEIYHLSRKTLAHRPLRRMFGTSDKRRAVIVPKFPVAHQGGSRLGFLTTHDAITLARILTVMNKFVITVDVLSAGRLPDEVPEDVICLGGPGANLATEFYMRQYCPGFIVHRRKGKDGRCRIESYECGGKTFVNQNEDCWGFIAKLSVVNTGLPGTTLLFWGHDDIGTAAAAFFASSHADKLSKLSRDSLFVAVLANSRLGYRSVRLAPIDLSANAFQKTVD